MDDTEFITSEPEQQVAPEEVAKFIQEEVAVEQEENNKEQATNIKRTKDGVEIQLGANKTYEVPAQEEAFKKLYVKVYDTDIPVTQADQILYLKAVLNDDPVILNVEMPNGFSAKCRALNAYEADIALLAAQTYITKYDVKIIEAALAPLQGCKAAMQLVSVNGKQRDYTAFTFEPGKSDRIKDAEKLLDAMGVLESTLSMPVYGLCLRALNTFESKFNRLNELAYNGNFWLPGSTD